MEIPLTTSRKHFKTSKSRSNCCVPFCSNQRYADVSLHKFPTESPLREQWIRLFKMSPKYVPKIPLACSDHFELTDFIKCSTNTKKRRLKKGVLPTKKLPCSTLQSLDATVLKQEKEKTFKFSGQNRDTRMQFIECSTKSNENCSDSSIGKIRSSSSHFISKNFKRLENIENIRLKPNADLKEEEDDDDYSQDSASFITIDSIIENGIKLSPNNEEISYEINLVPVLCHDNSSVGTQTEVPEIEYKEQNEISATINEDLNDQKRSVSCQTNPSITELIFLRNEVKFLKNELEKRQQQLDSVLQI